MGAKSGIAMQCQRLAELRRIEAETAESCAAYHEPVQSTVHGREVCFALLHGLSMFIFLKYIKHPPGIKPEFP